MRSRGRGLRIEADHVGQAVSLLSSLASDLDLVEERFGNMTGAVKLRSRSSNGFEVLARANELALDPRIGE